MGLGSGAALALLPAFWDLAGVGGRTRVARRLASRLGYPLRLTPPSVALAARARGTRAGLRRNKDQRVQSPTTVSGISHFMALGHEHYVCRRARAGAVFSVWFIFRLYIRMMFARTGGSVTDVFSRRDLSEILPAIGGLSSSSWRRDSHVKLSPPASMAALVALLCSRLSVFPGCVLARQIQNPLGTNEATMFLYSS